MVGKKVETAYYIQKDWKASPQVWSTLFWTFVWGMVAGIVLVVWLMAGHIDKNSTHDLNICKPSAPAQKK
jgi:hypothetical protein